MELDSAVRACAREQKRFIVFKYDSRGQLSNVEVHEVRGFHNNLGLKAVVPPISAELPLENWWFNGHIVCNTAAPWKPKGLQTLCEVFSRVPGPPGKAVIINVRDFPFQNKESDDTFSVCSHYGGSNWKDILVPPQEHFSAWEQVSSTRAYPFRFKTSKAVFRGTLTGRYTDSRNVRVRLAELSLQRPDLLDAKLSKWTNRERVISLDQTTGTLYVETPPPLRAELMGEELSTNDQGLFQVLVYAPGHVAASRLAWNLCCGSVVVLLDDPSCVAPDQWFQKELDSVSAPLRSICSTTVAVQSTTQSILSDLERLLKDQTLLTRLQQNTLAWAKTIFQRAAVESACAEALRAAAIGMGKANV